VAAASTCLFCNTPFKPNSELASIPEAHRIAFDPDNGRVWRICHHCHEWNLLGGDTAADALPELQSRFAVGVQGSALEGIDAAEVSENLILLRVGTIEREPVQQLFVKRRAQELIKNRRRVLLWAGFLIIYGASRLATSSILLEGLSMGFFVLGGTELMQRAANRRAGAMTGRRGDLTYVACAVVGAIGFLLTAPAWWPVIPVLGIGGWLASKRLSPAFVVELTLDDVPWVKLSEDQVGAIRFGWDLETYELTLTGLPDCSTIRGPNAELLLQVLLGRHSASQPRKVLDAGHRLAEQVGQAKGILRMLEGIRSEQDNQIDIATLPPVYRVALDMLLAPDLTFLGEADRLHERREEAARVAAEAEELDRLMLEKMERLKG
jgi:hypothetical protein